MMLGLGILPTLLVVFAGPSLFELIFGAEWREAGEYARWLVVMGMASLTTAPATELMYVCKLQKWLLSLTILQLLVTIASIVVGGIAGDPLLAIILLSSSMTLVSLGYLLAVMRYVGSQLREELR
jgi:O-antigen/teichoic acid export membrane protein